MYRQENALILSVLETTMVYLDIGPSDISLTLIFPDFCVK